MTVHLTAADLAHVMMLLDTSTIARNIGRHLVFAVNRHAVCSHSDLGCCADVDTSWVGGVDQVLDLRHCVLVWIATSFRPRPRMCKHANPVQPCSTRFLPGHVFPHSVSSTQPAAARHSPLFDWSILQSQEGLLSQEGRLVLCALTLHLRPRRRPGAVPPI